MEGASFNWRFFRLAPNSLAQLLPEDEKLSEYLQVIDLPQVTHGYRLEVLMDGANNDEAIGYLIKSNQNDQVNAKDQSSLGYPFVV